MNGQMKYFRAGEFLPHFFLGRINHQPLACLEDQFGNFDETPQATAADALAIKLVHLAVIEEYDFIKCFSSHFDLFWSEPQWACLDAQLQEGPVKQCDAEAQGKPRKVRPPGHGSINGAKHGIKQLQGKP